MFFLLFNNFRIIFFGFIYDRVHICTVVISFSKPINLSEYVTKMLLSLTAYNT